MNRTLITALGALAMTGLAASASLVVDIPDDPPPMPRPKKSKAESVRLPDRPPALKEKSASLKRMLGRKGRA